MSRNATVNTLPPLDLARFEARHAFLAELRSHQDVARRHHADLLDPNQARPGIASAC
jgi:hypothetical protein